MLCPLCARPSPAVTTLSGGDIGALLRETWGEDVPQDVVLADYTMRRCESCTLVFADPMRAGDGAYYRWVTGFARYHAGARWEWRVMRRLLARRGPTTLLDIGCGDGKFLAALSGLGNVTARGIDLDANNVERARARGVEARQASARDILREGARFDVIFMSHVLEHVENPLEIVSLAKRMLNPGGEIVFSVPYSPTSREVLRPDIMNLPPHHLTRWNMRALEALAAKTDLALSYEMRRPKSLVKRALRHVGESAGGTGLGAALSHPAQFLAALKLYGSREKVGGRRAADEILVRLRTV